MIAADSALGIVFGLAAEFLRGAAASGAAVCQRLADQRSGFSETEASEFLDGDGPDEIVEAEVHCADCNCPTICGCGREIYADGARYSRGLPMWYHRDDDSPITQRCADIRDGRTTPGRGDGPHALPLPGDFDATTAAYRAVMEWIDGHPDRGLIGCTPSMVAGVALNAYLGALSSIPHGELMSRIHASLSGPGGMRPTEADAFAECVATDLLDEYRITKK